MSKAFRNLLVRCRQCGKVSQQSFSSMAIRLVMPECPKCHFPVREEDAVPRFRRTKKILKCIKGVLTFPFRVLQSIGLYMMKELTPLGEEISQRNERISAHVAAEKAKAEWGATERAEAERCEIWMAGLKATEVAAAKEAAAKEAAALEAVAKEAADKETEDEETEDEETEDEETAEHAKGYGFAYPLMHRPFFQHAVLRPLRQNLHDTEIWSAGCRDYRRELFTNRRTLASGAPKNEFLTNMPGDGMLGTPLEFDLFGFQGRLNHGVSSKNFNAFYGDSTGNGGVFKWIFGQQTIWLSTQCQQIPQGIGLLGLGITSEKLVSLLAASASMKLDAASQDMLEKLASLLAESQKKAKDYYDFTNQMRQARKIFSNETFRNLVEHPWGFTAQDEDVYWTTVAVGMLYASL